jgi:hypothetical protein
MSKVSGVPAFVRVQDSGIYIDSGAGLVHV